MRDGRTSRSAKAGRVLAPRALRLATLGLMLGLAIPSTARTPTLSANPPPTQPLPYRDVSTRTVLPPAAGFDVAVFEAMAEQLVEGRRVPGLAMAVVQG